MSDIGLSIRRLREGQKLTREALARVSDVPTTTITKIEHGKTDNPGIQTIEKIAQGLGVSIADLLSDVETEVSRVNMVT